MKFNTLSAIVLAAFFSCFSHSSWAAAGRVAFVTGEATIERKVGDQSTTLKAEKGIEIQPGDKLITGTQSRLQWKMADDAVIALGSNSVFIIREYSAATPKAEGKAFYTLAKGALRMLSGLIGKKNPDAFSLATPTATMGIRGTILGAVVMNDADGNPVTVFTCDSGKIFVESGGVIVEVAAGDAPIATSENSAPVEATADQIAAVEALASETAVDSSVNDMKVDGSDGESNSEDATDNNADSSQSNASSREGEPPLDETLDDKTLDDNSPE